MLPQHSASLTVIGYADVRGSSGYNHALSERRAALVRDCLISEGVPADAIKIRAEGKDKALDWRTVEALLAQDDQKSDKWMTKNGKTTWLAFNRRADLVLEPTGRLSGMIYPTFTADAQIVWQQKEPSLKRVEMASKTAHVEQASAISSAKGGTWE